MQPSRQAKELMSWTKRKRRDKHICGYSKKIKIKIKKKRTSLYNHKNTTTATRTTTRPEVRRHSGDIQ